MPELAATSSARPRGGSASRRARLSLLVGAAALAALTALAGCRRKGAGSGPRSTPDPMERPASVCRALCVKQVLCRLGRPETKEQRQVASTEFRSCTDRCYAWMAAHPGQAAARAACLKDRDCTRFRACSEEVVRLADEMARPDKQRECLGLCVDVGQCDGPERMCIERCKALDIAVFRALEHCVNRSCPAVRTCYEKHVAHSKALW